ncbi:hypothetical protein L6452_24006 [Arctium lappa]|uniref:Uncharacterized protein n=1 Tax=Arctium lappa TaxID=4217 RepID=A0ACB9AD25_ARCLA|nr:hypothetical protein L6452_24006 [Arctium lappa]
MGCNECGRVQDLRSRMDRTSLRRFPSVEDAHRLVGGYLNGPCSRRQQGGDPYGGYQILAPSDFKIGLVQFSALRNLQRIPMKSGHGGGGDGGVVAGKTDGISNNKPQFKPAIDDTKPLLQDPILRSDPIETEEAVLRLPPFPPITSSSQ